MIEQYFNDTLAEGFAAQNQMYATISALLRRSVKTDAAVQPRGMLTGSAYRFTRQT